MENSNQKPGALDRFLKLFGDVRSGEGAAVILMLLNLMLILVSYYIIKVVREPLILKTPGGPELKSYGSAGQALALMLYIPFYGWFSSRVSRMKLVVGVTIFFILCIQFFYFAVRLDLPYIGFAFFIWVGIFSLSIIAQFWSLANDVYSRSVGERLFPVIAIGATLGSPIGSKLAGALIKLDISFGTLMQISAGILLLSLVLYVFINTFQQRQTGVVKTEEKLKSGSGFPLVFRNPYILLIAVLLLVLNLVNTTGEYILSKKVVEAADLAIAANPAVQKGAFIGGFYADFFFWVNIITFLVQAFLVSRLVKLTGIGGVILLLPLIALGAYALTAAGVGFALFRWLKTAENSTDYSVMNTGRAMLWLPTTREEKYQGKQTVDTFFVRFGDVLSAGCVFVGTTWLQLSISGFAVFNVGMTLVWIGLAFVLIRYYKRLAENAPSEDTRPAAAEA